MRCSIRRRNHQFAAANKKETGNPCGGTKEAFVRIEKGQVFLYGVHVNPYEKSISVCGLNFKIINLIPRIIPTCIRNESKHTKIGVGERPLWIRVFEFILPILFFNVHVGYDFHVTIQQAAFPNQLSGVKINACFCIFIYFGCKL